MKNIYWIGHAEQPKLAIVERPRGDEWLDYDLAALERDGIDVLVSLLTAQEVKELGLSKEQEFANALGMQFISYPIPDGTTPRDPQSFHELAAQLANAIQSGKNVGAHCYGCIGRATLTTAAVLIELGWKAKDALALVEQGRGCPVPDTRAQKAWIRRYKPEGPTG
jgi:protein-tyrosine phosphatase